MRWRNGRGLTRDYRVESWEGIRDEILGETGREGGKTLPSCMKHTRTRKI